ncbi:MAG: hypothetical protein MI919_07675 [Holophagales bacterium]|nr:hypothetical protein [Holophagales bacterium]
MLPRVFSRRPISRRAPGGRSLHAGSWLSAAAVCLLYAALPATFQNASAEAQALPERLDSGRSGDLPDPRTLDRHCPVEGTFLCLLLEEDFGLRKTGMPGLRQAALTEDDGTLSFEAGSSAAEVRFEPAEGDHRAAVRSWRFEFRPPENRNLDRGTYPDAVYRDRESGRPAIEATAWSSACRSSGGFEVWALGADRSHLVRRLGIDFLVRCTSGSGVLLGRACLGCSPRQDGAGSGSDGRLAFEHRPLPASRPSGELILEVVISNPTPREAAQVATSHRLSALQPVSVRTSRGHCHVFHEPPFGWEPDPPRDSAGRPIPDQIPGPRSGGAECYFGDLPPGATAEIAITVRPARSGRAVHAAVLDTLDPELLPDHHRELVELELGDPAAGGDRP